MASHHYYKTDCKIQFIGEDVEISGPDVLTGQLFRVVIKKAEYDALEAGQHFQDAIRSVNSEQVEFLISGLTPSSFPSALPDMHDEPHVTRGDPVDATYRYLTGRVIGVLQRTVLLDIRKQRPLSLSKHLFECLPKIGDVVGFRCERIGFALLKGKNGKRTKNYRAKNPQVDYVKTAHSQDDESIINAENEMSKKQEKLLHLENKSIELLQEVTSLRIENKNLNNKTSELEEKNNGLKIVIDKLKNKLNDKTNFNNNLEAKKNWIGEIDNRIFVYDDSFQIGKDNNLYLWEFNKNQMILFNAELVFNLIEYVIDHETVRAVNSKYFIWRENSGDEWLRNEKLLCEQDSIYSNSRKEIREYEELIRKEEEKSHRYNMWASREWEEQNICRWEYDSGEPPDDRWSCGSQIKDSVHPDDYEEHQKDKERNLEDSWREDDD